MMWLRNSKVVNLVIKVDHRMRHMRLICELYMQTRKQNIMMSKRDKKQNRNKHGNRGIRGHHKPNTAQINRMDIPRHFYTYFFWYQ